MCKKEDGHIINKITLKKYKENKKIESIKYEWETKKRDNAFHIVYNDKIINLIKKKILKAIKIKFKKKKQFKKDNPKPNKRTKLLGSINYKDYNNRLNSQLNEINICLQILIDYFNEITPLEFIKKILN